MIVSRWQEYPKPLAWENLLPCNFWEFERKDQCVDGSNRCVNQQEALLNIWWTGEITAEHRKTTFRWSMVIIDISGLTDDQSMFWLSLGMSVLPWGVFQQSQRLESKSKVALRWNEDNYAWYISFPVHFPNLAPHLVSFDNGCYFCCPHSEHDTSNKISVSTFVLRVLSS